MSSRFGPQIKGSLAEADLYVVRGIVDRTSRKERDDEANSRSQMKTELDRLIIREQ